MNKQLSIWRFILEGLEHHIPVMLLYVLDSDGSSPGRQGFFMAVNARGEMRGSIGGGIMEHKFAELAKETLRILPARGPVIKTQFHDKKSAANQSGMICSGKQTILQYIVREPDRMAIRLLISSLEQEKNGVLQLSPSGISFNPAFPLFDYEFQYKNEEDWIYREKTGFKFKLSIIGGGHCALALSRLMRPMDFFIRVYEDRGQLYTLEENEAAHEKIIVNDYSELEKLLEPGPDHYVVIMTMGYRTDDIALKAILGKEFAYLGLLGSAFKTQKMIEEYRKEGIPVEWLERINAPAGIAVKSQTPEEIAVSIAAEIIHIKNKYR
ncbi:MAG TPA: XdhC family protein [Chitinophagaceae bacterium]|nr:XdhC family protein [Chitinophagaceae bacterium]